VSEKFGTILVDPPWPYERAQRWKDENQSARRLTGYSNFEYEPLSLADLAALPVGDHASDEAVLLLWGTWPMLPAALGLIEAWGFQFVTGLPWVKTEGLERTKANFEDDDELRFSVSYGVGYWFRGATEPILLAKRPGAPSVRTQWAGLICDRAKHSRKPDSIYQLAESESFPKPRLEMFARRIREGWTQYGDDIDGRDIREVMAA